MWRYLIWIWINDLRPADELFVQNEIDERHEVPDSLLFHVPGDQSLGWCTQRFIEHLALVLSVRSRQRSL